MAENKVSVELTLEQGEALKQLASLGRSLDSFADRSTNAAKKASSSFSTFGTTVAGVFAGGALLKAADLFLGAIASIPGAITDVVKAGIEAEEVNRRFEQSLVLVGEAGTEAAKSLSDAVQEVSRLAGVEDEAVSASATFALNLGATAEQAEKIIRTAADVSSAIGVDFNTAVQQLSQTLEGSSGRLSKIDGDIKGLSEEALRSGAAIDILAQKFSGFAALNAGNLSVQLSNVGIAAGNLEEAIGAAIQASPALRGLVTTIGETINSLTRFFEENRGQITQFTDTLINGFVKTAEVSAVFADAVVRTFTVIKNTVEVSLGAVAAGFNTIEAGISVVLNPLRELAGLEPNTSAFDRLGESVQSVNEDFKELGEAIAPGNYTAATQAVLSFSDQFTLNAQKVVDADKRQSDALQAESDRRATIRDQEKASILANQAELDAIRAQAQLVRDESVLLEQEITSGRNAETLAAIQEFERQKLEIQFQAELSKATLINDSAKREQEVAKINQTKILEQERLASKQRIQQKQFEKEQNEKIFQSNLQATQNFLAAGLVLAKEGSVAQKALQITQATVNTYAAANQALAAVPFPANIPAVAGVIALGLANVLKIAGAKFANGGIVGGNSTSGDRIPIRVNSGEMVLNDRQQAQLFDLANGGGGGGAGVVQAINALGDRIERMQVSLEVNGREIARVVRDEREAGFAV